MSSGHSCWRQPSDGSCVDADAAFVGHSGAMAELVRTNNPAMISVIEGLLTSAEIPYHVADRNMSVMEGLIQVIQVRILVPDERMAEARELLVDAELEDWLSD